MRTSELRTGALFQRASSPLAAEFQALRLVQLVCFALLTTSLLHAADGDNWPDQVVPLSGSPAYPDDPTQAPVTTWPPKGNPEHISFTADDWFSNADVGGAGNGGKANRLKLKGQQEMFVFKIDIAKLKGKVVTGALLHVRCASPDDPFHRVGISSVGATWQEGSAAEAYTPVVGAPCWLQAEYKKRDWSFPGSTVIDVAFGRAGTVWGFANCTAPDKDGWQVVAVDPRTIKANIAGTDDGFLAYDEVGNQWSDTGGKFQWFVFPNRFCYSREQTNSAPWMEVWTAGADTQAPDPVKYSRVETAVLPAGEAFVDWIVPADQGAAGVSEFAVTYAGPDGATHPMPRYLIPAAGAVGSRCRMHIKDLPFTAGETLQLTIRAIDGAGNVSEPFTRTVILSSLPRELKFGPEPLKAFPPNETLPSAGPVQVAVIDALDKIDPVSGRMIPAEPKGYLGGNHLYSGADKRIRLQAGRNEIVDFQVVLHGTADNVKVQFAFANPEAKADGADKPNPQADLVTSLHEFTYVKAGKEFLPDPLVPCDGTVAIPSKAGPVRVPGQQWHALIAEVYVPHQADPGVHQGTLTVEVGDQKLTLNVDLTVWHFTLPDVLSFVPEMNSYRGDRFPAQWLRLAHYHRTAINQLWYHWSGSQESGLKWDGHNFDWTEFDQNIGPELDGSLFKGLPRDGVPTPMMYLPFNETWPVKLQPNYRGVLWADEAFNPSYRKELQEVFTAFAKHADEKGWDSTFFEFFLNNKAYYRDKTRQVVAPWCFDEPINTQDFWALRWYGMVYHEAVNPVRGKAKMIFRADISYGQFERNMEWGVIDWECIGGGSAEKARQKRNEFDQMGMSYFSEYGSANRIEDANIQPVAWCLTSWSRGSSGVLPWETIGTTKTWEEATQTSLFYPTDNGQEADPSVRLDAFTRGQQDVEYLTLLGDCTGSTRGQVAAGLLDSIDLTSHVVKTSETDAGTAQFKGASPEALWALRTRIAAMIDAKNPPYKKALVDWSTPANDLKHLPDIGYVPVAPKVPSYSPPHDTFGER
ncbi:MAG: hypothetical protein ACREJ2_17345 [Planctomycetota bacterium]